MNSQVYKIPASELSVGDVICGVDETAWTIHYELIQKYNPDPGVMYCRYSVKRVHPQTLEEEIPWSPPLNALIRVKHMIYQYDPSQAGDTEEDV